MCYPNSMMHAQESEAIVWRRHTFTHTNLQVGPELEGSIALFSHSMTRKFCEHNVILSQILHMFSRGEICVYVHMMPTR